MNAQSERPSAVSQAEFARLRGVSKAIVTKWKGQGILVVNEAGLVDIERTEWNLDQRPAKYRGGTAHRPVRAVPGSKPAVDARGSAPTKGGVLKTEETSRPSDPAPDDGLPPGIDLNDENLPTAEAVRRKENYLGLLRKRELEISNKEWVRVEDVGMQVDRAYAVVRERLLNIPGKLGADLTPDQLARVEAEIRDALSELHDGGEIAERIAASGLPTGPSPDDPQAATSA